MASGKDTSMTSRRPTPQDLDQSRSGWYFALMEPAEKPHPFPWLLPAAIYAYPTVQRACVNDLLAAINVEDVDYVAGIDSVGYILGSVIALELGKGLIAMGKAGKMCVNTDEVRYTDYQGTEKGLEIPKQVVPRGSRVFVYDQWIETGGTMNAAISLLEGQGCKIAGVGAILIQENDVSRRMRSQYHCVECCPSQLKPFATKETSEQFFKACYEMYYKK